jgi:hypothetical protein
MKKSVSSSHLALRFYKSQGWTRADLEPYLLRGQVEDTSELKNDEPAFAYFILAPGGALDMKRLLAEQISEVRRYYLGGPKETDLEYLESFNW